MMKKAIVILTLFIFLRTGTIVGTSIEESQFPDEKDDVIIVDILTKAAILFDPGAGRVEAITPEQAELLIKFGLPKAQKPKQ